MPRSRRARRARAGLRRGDGDPPRAARTPARTRTGSTTGCGGELQAAARAAGLLTPQAPVAEGGHGLDHRGQAVVFEEAGYSLLGPQALNCAAPDEGNMHLLRQVATPEQRERYLAPLVRGDVALLLRHDRAGAGRRLRPLDAGRRRRGATATTGCWTGDKWFITGADGAAFAIVMARTGERIDRDEGATMFLVDAGTPGLRRAARGRLHRPRRSPAGTPRCDFARRARARATPCSARSGSATATPRCAWRRRG